MFVIPPSEGPMAPATIYSRLLDHEEHRHLAEHKPPVAFLLREGPWAKQGRTVLGTCSMPSVQGELRSLFEWLLEDKLGYWPTFLFTLSGEFWTEGSDRVREILMFHEMLHAAQAVDEFGGPKFTRDGEPVWRIRGHDVEEFNAVAKRYGAWKPDLKLFADALGVGVALTEGAGA